MPPPSHAAPKSAPAPTRVIAVTGGKGGTGKTCVAINLATALVQAGRDVLLLDGDLGLSNVDVMLGLAPAHTLEQVLKGERTLDEIIVCARSGLRVVPAASGVAQMARLDCRQHGALINAFQALPRHPEVLIIDTAPGIPDSVLSFSQAAQEILVVLRNEPASLTDAYGLIKILSRDHQVTRFRVLVNQVRSQDEGAGVYKRLHAVTDRYLQVELDLAGVILDDAHVLKAVRAQRAVVEAYPDCVAARAIRQLAQRIEGWPRPAGPSGRVEFYLDQLVSTDKPQSLLKVIK